MLKKILFCASTASHILNFHLPYLQFFHEMGWQVDVIVASKEEIPYADNVIVLPIKKSLLSAHNLHAIYSVKRLLAKKRYDIISVHTTLAGAVVRLAVLLSRNKFAKVVYTSHGYFFNEEAVATQWPYLWVEKLVAPVTDILMVMNRTDYKLAIRHKLCKEIVFIPGMGLDVSKFIKGEREDKMNLKKEAGFDPSDFLIVYVAEMSKRKNQAELIRAFVEASDQEPSLRLLLAGEGDLKGEYEKVAKKSGRGKRIHFLGQVSNVALLYKMCDLVVSTSQSEGLPFNLMEAMACSLPVVATNIKGHTDLLGGSQKLFIYNLGDERTLTEMILMLFHNENLRVTVGNENKINIQKYRLELVRQKVVEGYGNLIV